MLKAAGKELSDQCQPCRLVQILPRNRKPFSKNIPRRIFEDRRDAKGVCIFYTSPYVI